jgi:phage terminase large subunit-like protein
MFRCPNCESMMNEGETCPECEHDDRIDEVCQCEACLDGDEFADDDDFESEGGDFDDHDIDT